MACGDRYIIADFGSSWPTFTESRSDGRFVLAYGSNGGLILYTVPAGGILWLSSGAASGGYLVTQSDGNLVLFTSGGTPVWATNTNNNNGAYLILQDDGNAVIYDTMGHSLWATNTCCH